MTVSPEVARVLRDAADFIEEHGWTQGVMFDTAGRHCAVGAIWACRDGLDGFDVEDEVVRALNSSVGAWNDAPGRTQAEVVAKLRELAGSAA